MSYLKPVHLEKSLSWEIAYIHQHTQHIECGEGKGGEWVVGETHQSQPSFSLSLPPSPPPSASEQLTTWCSPPLCNNTTFRSHDFQPIISGHVTIYQSYSPRAFLICLLPSLPPLTSSLPFHPSLPHLLSSHELTSAHSSCGWTRVSWVWWHGQLEPWVLGPYHWGLAA